MSNRNGKQPNRKNGIKLSRAEKIAIPVIIIIGIWVAYSALSPQVPSNPSTTIATSQSGLAPDFTLPVVGPNGLTGDSISLSSFRGKVVLLEFMEPWCPHCQNIAPTIETWYKQYGKNIVFLTVAGPWNNPQTGQPATASDAAQFIRTYGSSWIYVYDSSSNVMNNLYNVNSTPTFFIVGKDGSVLASCNQGEACAEQLAPQLAQLNG